MIKAAYRSLSAKYHPDKNPGDARCVRIMAIINEAYAVLSDPVRRKQHDDWIATNTEPLEPDFQSDKFEADPDARQAGKAQGRSPEPTMSQWAARSGQRSQSGAMDLSPAAKIGVILSLVGTLAFCAYGLQPAKKSGLPTYQGEERGDPYASTTLNVDETMTTENVVANDLAMIDATTPDDAPSDFLLKAPNGSEWPISAGYVEGYPRLRSGGYSSVTVDNSGNSSDVFVKLVAIDADKSSPIRHIFIPKNGTFTMRSLRPGQYDVRYQDLSDGSLMRSEEFELDEVHETDGVRYSTMTLTLYKVPNGNMRTYPLDPSEF